MLHGWKTVIEKLKENRQIYYAQVTPWKIINFINLGDYYVEKK